MNAERWSDSRLQEFRREFIEFRDEMREWLKTVFPAHAEGEEQMFRKLLEAFPQRDGGADLSGHRSAHEALIKAAAAEERFWSELRLEVAKKGVIGLLTLILGLIGIAVAAKFGIKP